MADIKDLLTPVTATVQQPPSGVDVKASTNTTAEANVLNQAEAKEQANVQADKTVDAKEGYIFKLEQGRHRLVIGPEHTGVYNFLARCSCGWEGRFMTSDLAELTAKKHVITNKR
jgi:hypothetical protein